MSKVNTDNASYFHFTGPARLNKAVHELHGILLGITADAKVSDDELGQLLHWLNEHREVDPVFRTTGIDGKRQLDRGEQ